MLLLSFFEVYFIYANLLIYKVKEVGGWKKKPKELEMFIPILPSFLEYRFSNYKRQVILSFHLRSFVLVNPRWSVSLIIKADLSFFFNY